jgi:hypothetical protein
MRAAAQVAPENLVNRPPRASDLIRDFRRPEPSAFSALIREWSRLISRPLYLPLLSPSRGWFRVVIDAAEAEGQGTNPTSPKPL